MNQENRDNRDSHWHQVKVAYSWAYDNAKTLKDHIETWIKLTAYSLGFSAFLLTALAVLTPFATSYVVPYWYTLGKVRWTPIVGQFLWFVKVRSNGPRDPSQVPARP